MPFSFSEFIITHKNIIPVHVADKLMKYHIIPMSRIRNTMGIPIWASEFSGYRPKWWELKKGRSGKSQHTFEGKGAVDWTCEDFEGNKPLLSALIIKHTDYTRISVYDTFIHCDYKETKSGKRELYESNVNSKWTLIKKF